MKVSGPIIMQSFSASRLVDMRRKNHGADLFASVLSVHWCEERGGREASISERWSAIAPNMFVVTSPKK